MKPMGNGAGFGEGEDRDVYGRGTMVVKPRHNSIITFQLTITLAAPYFLKPPFI